MKIRNLVLLMFFGLIIFIGCSDDSEVENNDFMAENNDSEIESNQYEFIKAYSTTITVGGVVGITERTFEIGEVYTSTSQDNNIITIRIAESSELKNDCPNPWCSQDLLDIPSEFLQLVE